MDKLQAFVDVAVPLIAQDLKCARTKLGIATTGAAKKAGITSHIYKMIESGKVTKNVDTFATMISVARSLGLDSVRMLYVEEYETYMRYNLEKEQPFTLFVDSISSNVHEQREMGHFVSPYNIFRLADKIGMDTIIASQNAIDKEIFELWVTAVFSLSLDSRNSAYYVRLVRDNAPDTEILEADFKESNIQIIKIEVTHYNKHSDNIYEIIKKKLTKRYDKNTVIVIYTSKNDEIYVNDLYDFIQKNNSDKRQIDIVTGTCDRNIARIIPCGKIKSDEKTIEWAEIKIDLAKNKAMRYKYDGVIYKARYLRGYHTQFPVFIKEIGLSR